MPNLMDYLEWRGDLTFTEAPLCEVDNLVFCLLAYVALMLFQALEISWCRQFTAPVALFRYALVGLMALETILAVYLFPVIAAFLFHLLLTRNHG